MSFRRTLISRPKPNPTNKIFAANPKYGRATVAVAPHKTSQNCSNCGQKVPKSLFTRTHVCPDCGYVEDRDENAAIKCDSFSRNLEIGG